MKQIKQWLGNFFYRSRMYCYGPVLIIFELVLRYGLKLTDAQAFIGPSIAVAGASALIPLTLEKPLTSERKAKLQLPADIIDKLDLMQRSGCTLITEKEKKFIGTCWAFIFICTGAWFSSLFLSLTEPDNTLLQLPTNYWPGIIIFVISVVLSEIREELI